MSAERANQTKAELSKKLTEAYVHRLPEEGNGHVMERWVERRPFAEPTYVLIVRDPDGKCVAVSRTPQPDPDAEREFTLDFLLEEKK